MIQRVWHFLRYVGIFTKELAIANFQVAKLVLTPTMNIRPGFLALPLEAETDFEITSYANSITLTPGTISVHVEREHRVIIVHFLDLGGDHEAARREIKETLEDNILKWTRDAPSPSEPPSDEPADDSRAAADAPASAPGSLEGGAS